MSEPSLIKGPAPHTENRAEVLVIGAGACGLTAALVARYRGRDVLIVERDASPSGSTSMSSGYVPAAATRFQRAAGIKDDTPEVLISDIMLKSAGLSDSDLARLAAFQIGPAIEWLAENAGLDWIVLCDFLYPGHSRHRMHAMAERTGASLEAQLLSAALAAEIPLLTEARAVTLWQGLDGRIEAVGVERAGGELEVLKTGSVILACNGYGGNPDLVAAEIPEMAAAPYYGHAGNTGDALVWGRALGARLQHLSGYQGHGALATPQNIPITWALMTAGGVQVNAEGNRFSNELTGYSEAAPKVLAEPGGVAWVIHDARCHAFAMEGFADYRDAFDLGAIKSAETLAGLASVLNLPPDTLGEALAPFTDHSGETPDPFGRPLTDTLPLAAPYYGVKVTGALFHTQGGVQIDKRARVVLEDGTPLPNLFAAGGAACGVSGPKVEGYLSGNGLLSAIAFGFVAGTEA